MADVYKFKVRLCELENAMWRDIEITSVSSVAKLGYAVLAAFESTAGDKLSMEYDYGAGWEFEIELLSITEMKRGAGTHYPYVNDGKGKGIIEDTSPYEVAEMIEKIDKDGTLPQIMDMYSGKEVSWDYRKFDLEYCNVFFKDNVWKIQNAYEEYE